MRTLGKSLHTRTRTHTQQSKAFGSHFNAVLLPSELVLGYLSTTEELEPCAGKLSWAGLVTRRRTISGKSHRESKVLQQPQNH